MSDKKTPPVREWVLSPDMGTVRKALSGMMGSRKFSQTKLAVEMNSTSSSMFSAFLRGDQAHMRMDSILRAAEAMGYEVVIREPQTNRTQRRLAALKEAKVKARGGEVPTSPEVKAEWANMVAPNSMKITDIEDPDLQAAVERMLRG